MILQPKMRVVLNSAPPTPGIALEKGLAGHVVRIGSSSGLEGVPLVQFDNGALLWIPAESLDPEPPYVIHADQLQAIAESARDQIGIALKAGQEDAARIEWLDEIAAFSIIAIAFEIDGGVHLTIESPGIEAYAAREQSSVRAAIDTARKEYNPED